MKAQYHVFYTWAYGRDAKYECFDELAPVLALVKKAQPDEEGFTPYIGLRIIHGEALEFEPATYVETFRVKQRANGDAV